MLERLTARGLALAASLGSALLLAGAFAFQAAGHAPCELCILQRWPHLAAVIVGAGSASFEMLRHLTERLPATSRNTIVHGDYRVDNTILAADDPAPWQTWVLYGICVAAFVTPPVLAVLVGV